MMVNVKTLCCEKKPCCWGALALTSGWLVLVGWLEGVEVILEMEIRNDPTHDQKYHEWEWETQREQDQEQQQKQK